MSKHTLVIHGGAGTILRSAMSASKEAAYRQGLEEALTAGFYILSKGGSAIDAVMAATISLEDNILFNAGRGSVFAKDGTQEMDASIMDGSNLAAGAVAAVKNIRNPIKLAHAIMTQSPHVMLNGKGANDFASSIGMKEENDEYFFSQFRYDQWQDAKEMDRIALDHNIHLKDANESAAAKASADKDKKFGTVGAAACDQYGNIAAATSTGGMTNKQWGRVGDSPILGAGTYANNLTCAISGTGHGELFIRAVAAYDVSCLMEYKGLSLQEAMDIVVNEKLVKIKGEGGMVGVDAKGNAAMLFNSDGMYRGMMDSVGKVEVAIYK